MCYCITLIFKNIMYQGLYLPIVVVILKSPKLMSLDTVPTFKKRVAEGLKNKHDIHRAYHTHSTTVGQLVMGFLVFVTGSL